MTPNRIDEIGGTCKSWGVFGHWGQAHWSGLRGCLLMKIQRTPEGAWLAPRQVARLHSTSLEVKQRAAHLCLQTQLNQREGENRSDYLEILKPRAVLLQSSEHIRLEWFLDVRLLAELPRFVILCSCVDTANEHIFATHVPQWRHNFVL